MRTSLSALLSAVTLTHSAAINPRSPTGGSQSVPNNPPTKFNNGAPQLTGEPPQDTTTPVPDIYGARDIDLPFYRLYNGNMKFFSAGQLNTPDRDVDVSLDAGGVDNANQSACGIPDNAFTKVAIHPYFLKYADLSRFCEQDVCISFWKEDGSSDMIVKVTDICSTDENDPTHCATPMDIKLERSKVEVMEHLTTPPSGNEYPEKTWFFTKCWADALVQPAYKNNWFAEPNLPNNLHWSQSTAMEQYQNNQKAYPAEDWPTYPNGGYNTTRVADPITDWVKGQEPCYEPIAGGKGWGTNFCGNGQKSSSPTSSAVVQAQPSSISSPVSSTTVASQSPQGTGLGDSASEAASSMASSSTSAPFATAGPPGPKPQGEEDEQDECEL